MGISCDHHNRSLPANQKASQLNTKELALTSNEDLLVPDGCQLQNSTGLKIFLMGNKSHFSSGISIAFDPLCSYHLIEPRWQLLGWHQGISPIMALSSMKSDVIQMLYSFSHVQVFFIVWVASFL